MSLPLVESAFECQELTLNKMHIFMRAILQIKLRSHLVFIFLFYRLGRAVVPRRLVGHFELLVVHDVAVNLQVLASLTVPSMHILLVFNLVSLRLIQNCVRKHQPLLVVALQQLLQNAFVLFSVCKLYGFLQSIELLSIVANVFLYHLYYIVVISKALGQTILAQILGNEHLFSLLKFDNKQFFGKFNPSDEHHEVDIIGEHLQF
jgi:hypothetical protein